MIGICAAKCKHESQDQLHGAGFRVLNESKNKTGGLVYRCTVCGREHIHSEISKIKAS